MGVDTGIDYLNRITSGWQNSNLIILAARPGMGKTSVMLHMAKSAAQSGFNVLIFSLEMSDKELTNKLILSEGNIDSGRYRNGTLNENEIKNMEYCAGLICKLPVIINDKSDISVRRIKNIAKLLKKKGKCDIVFIDYLQLLNMKHENKSYTREQEVSQATRSLKIMAKELDVPVVVLSQLSRNCEDRKDKRPLLSDLRESGAIEQDADIVLFLWRPEYYGLDTYDSRNTKGLMIIDIAKGRSIPTCEIEISYNEQFTKFIDLM
jgi:replicative DNA helicase